MGCWKIHYKNHEQKFILFHRNYGKGRIALSDVEKVPYHRQMPQHTRQQRCYYQAAKRRQEKRTAKRLDALFLMIEKKESIKQLSVW